MKTESFNLSITSLTFLVCLAITGLLSASLPVGADQPETRSDPITVYTESNPPFSYINQTGEINGSMVLLVQHLADRTQTKYTLDLRDWSSAYENVLSTPNTAIFPIVQTSNRTPLFKWVGPVDQMEYAFYCRSSEVMNVSSLEDISGAGIIAVPKETARHHMLKDANITNLLPVSTDAEAIDAVLHGKADIWLGTRNMYNDGREAFGADLNQLMLINSWKSVPLYIAFYKDTPDSLIERWQQEFDDLNRV
ncbi:MAG: transporter substrate-binding domain-containing protein [Methanospirillum sp.]|uniref:substrate-binding periplasmic protein n=1 Tax=Methanospirillum sp. TaxID=45200 RepID=UPI00236D2985|nr:transporter substrate-binding domain-containing protein [Methanospirillum sp.]MDD1729355.1 transporter substrate-binding domain-containing protein [Methanospirillum sp.]